MASHFAHRPQLRLVRQSALPACSETIAAIESLLAQARAGQVAGVTFIAVEPGMDYRVCTTGLLRSDPTFARGCVATLDDSLRDLVHGHQA